MTKKLKILIAGCGDVGTTAALLLAKDHTVFGLRRSKELLPQPIITISADLSQPNTLKKLPDIDILIYCAAPNIPRENRASLSITEKIVIYTDTYLHGFENLITALPNPPSHIFFTSSTTVYHQCDHQLVDENSPTEPENETGKIMLAAEQQILASEISASVIRFSGIYSDTRLNMFKQVANGKVYADSPLQYSNRIHVTDCAKVIHHLVSLVKTEHRLQPIYLASDEQPASTSVVSNWLAEQINITPSSILKGRTTGSKRCNNSLLLASGYQFIYPSFKEGYASAIEQFIAH